MKTTNERIAVVESEIKTLKEDNTSEHKELKVGQIRTNDKLDKIISQMSSTFSKKADKKELNRLDNKVWGIVMAIVVAFVGLIATAIKVFQ